MRSGGNNFNYSLENQLTKFANLVQFKSVHVLSGGLGGLGPLATPLLASKSSTGLRCGQ